MKSGAGHPSADPEAAARKRSLAASSPNNRPSFCDAHGTGSGFRTGMIFAVERDWIKRHESGTQVKPAEHGIESQPVIERETRRSPSRLLSLEPTDLLESIASSGRSGTRKASSTSSGRMTAMIEDNLARMRTHRNAIERHRRLLKTKLTEHDRQYVCRRLSEEECALESLRTASFPMVFTESSRPMTSAS